MVPVFCWEGKVVRLGTPSFRFWKALACPNIAQIWQPKQVMEMCTYRFLKITTADSNTVIQMLSQGWSQRFAHCENIKSKITCSPHCIEWNHLPLSRNMSGWAPTCIFLLGGMQRITARQDKWNLTVYWVDLTLFWSFWSRRTLGHMMTRSSSSAVEQWDALERYPCEKNTPTRTHPETSVLLLCSCFSG